MLSAHPQLPIMSTASRDRIGMVIRQVFIVGPSLSLRAIRSGSGGPRPPYPAGVEPVGEVAAVGEGAPVSSGTAALRRGRAVIAAAIHRIICGEYATSTASRTPLVNELA
jgi:hypothetical protein